MKAQEFIQKLKAIPQPHEFVSRPDWITLESYLTQFEADPEFYKSKQWQYFDLLHYPHWTVKDEISRRHIRNQWDYAILYAIPLLTADEYVEFLKEYRIECDRLTEQERAFVEPYRIRRRAMTEAIDRRFEAAHAAVKQAIYVDPLTDETTANIASYAISQVLKSLEDERLHALEACDRLYEDDIRDYTDSYNGMRNQTRHRALYRAMEIICTRL